MARYRQGLACAALALGLLVRAGAAQAQQPPVRDLEASLGLLPGLVDSREHGAFVELVKAMDAVYPGAIRINVYPMARSIRNLTSGKADFHLPALRDTDVPDSKLIFGVADEIIGTLSNVIYSNVNKPLSRADIDAALARGGPFPYLLEATGGDEAVSYPYQPNNQIVPKGERGREINAIVSECIRKLRASGELERLYFKIHRPYSDWQPAKERW
jgi:polar amino acid transport system substrate-binding protein